MKFQSQSIVFIGFKNVGKSVIGRELASQLEQPFLDLDEEVERAFESEYQEKISCQQIINTHGQIFFNHLERSVLAQIIRSRNAIISIGCSTPMDEDNQKIIKKHTIVYVRAPRGVVFERIMVQGRPVFFSPAEHPLESFTRLWNEREKTYKKLASFTIDNNGLVVSAVEQVLKNLLINQIA